MRNNLFIYDEINDEKKKEIRIKSMWAYHTNQGIENFTYNTFVSDELCIIMIQ